jgi:hypothetical protein
MRSPLPLKIACYCTANFGFGAFYALNNWILPPLVRRL